MIAEESVNRSSGMQRPNIQVSSARIAKEESNTSESARTSPVTDLVRIAGNKTAPAISIHKKDITPELTCQVRAIRERYVGVGMYCTVARSRRRN